MRPLWKGAVSFGLVYVPVKMYAATEKKSIKFNYLHDKCKTPIQYRRYCPYCNTEINNEEIVKGYEYEKGKYVVMKDEDFENLPGEKTKSINIVDFVDLTDIDPLYFDKGYYLAPGEGGQKVYELLKRSMQETGKVAVAKVIIRDKESLAALRVADGVLTINTMFYPDEVRKPSGIPELDYEIELHENELKMAVNLINNLSAPFKPEKYTDEYRQQLLEVIQAKIAGEEVEAVPAVQTDKVVDLMSALKASIDLAKQERDNALKKDATKKKTTRTKKATAS
ncbi:DNA end-binding protein Ku [Desulforamulus reducens MI-1]|uniref:Non-homologous end joining protein Ku n=1 Tax=Desulforamulus reducens (strain ATCC BAA-1160 / DSM 100696 / MI-1) TaxID=349161 RepID=A4J618_DESRM|nr:Ku protein [Desulforamulus reducens]ABO50521.1 DNA end-binding protein Ku [Desulforamulus reducens MI-1]